MQSVVDTKHVDSYSLEIMVRHVFDYEIQNKIRTKPNQKQERQERKTRKRT